MSRAMRGLIGGVMIATMCVGDAAIARAEQSADQAALRSFDGRMATYAALHRRLEEPLPPPTPSKSMATFLAARAYLRSAIKSARPHARQGDIFSPAVADVFRRTIADALCDIDAEELLRELYAEHRETHGFHPRVYDPYPDWASHEMPMVLLQRLPPLPDDVEYRLIDHDLVLWDTHADLIVDFLPDAIPRRSS